MTELEVDVTIAVHSATRPIARAVGSILDHTRAAVRVNVVAHNIDPGVIRTNLGDYADHSQVRLLPFADGIRSPAGPMNHGLSMSTAPFVSILGSDDEFAPGALDSWLSVQRETGATTVIPKIWLEGRGNDPYPPVRTGRRHRNLDAVRDRLSYRSAPLGLIDRNRFGDLRFAEGLPSGEDLSFSSELWFTGTAIAYDLFGPAYVGHEDATDRVTAEPRRVTEDFAFLDAIETSHWFPKLRRPQRTALAVKILRVHFFDAMAARLNGPEGLTPHREELKDVIHRLQQWSPQAMSLLARADRAVIELVFVENADIERMRYLLDARWNYRTLAGALPRNPFLALHRQAPFRTLFAGLRAMNVG